jgi:hypothetical protein
VERQRLLAFKVPDMSFENVVHLAQLRRFQRLGPDGLVPFKLELMDVVIELLLPMHCLLAFLMQKLFQLLPLLFEVLELLGEVLFLDLEFFRVLLLSLSGVEAVRPLVGGESTVPVIHTPLAYSGAAASAV